MFRKYDKTYFKFNFLFSITLTVYLIDCDVSYQNKNEMKTYVRVCTLYIARETILSIINNIDIYIYIYTRLRVHVINENDRKLE